MGIFKVSNGKGKGMLGFFDTLKIPIIENTAFEEDLTSGLEARSTNRVTKTAHCEWVWMQQPAPCSKAVRNSGVQAEGIQQ
jgi:hypothetical protein